MDWNSDGLWDIISGDRNGYLNVFIREDNPDSIVLTPYLMYQDMGGTAIDVGYNSEPNVFDWNGDGKKDLVIGQQDSMVRVYLNQGGDTWPEFQDHQQVMVNGRRVPFYRVNPYLFDLDDDGKDDLICGEQNGYVHFFQNVGDDTLPVFAAGETLKLESGAPVRWTRTAYYYGSRVGFGDWNNDGTVDMLLSTYEGQVELYLGAPEVGVEEGLNPRIAGFNVSPVPGGPPVRIEFATGRTAGVEMEVRDATGRVVRRFGNVSGRLDWNGTDDAGARLPAGVYFCHASDGDRTATARIVLTR